MMTAYACGSGGVIFVPEKIEKTTQKKVAIRRSNDNVTKTVAAKEDKE